MPPQYAALGDFTINAIPEGYVQRKANGKYDICINKVYYFINDSFNFEGLAYLGEWDLNPRAGEPQVDYPYFVTHLFNSDFREFTRHGYGRDVPVLSRLHEAELFKPDCREYSLEK